MKGTPETQERFEGKRNDTVMVLAVCVQQSGANGGCRDDMKKKNPSRMLRESDIRKIKKEAADAAVRYTLVLFLNAMRDSEGYGVKRLKRVYEAIEYLADSVSRGYVKIADLEKVLKEEANINIAI